MPCRAIFIIDADPVSRTWLYEAVAAKKSIPIQPFPSVEAIFAEYDMRERGIILMDMNLTHAPAMELLRIVNAEPERFEVIVIDGQPCVEIAVDAMKFGAIDYLVKPVDEIRLFGAIENAVARLQVVRAVSMKNIEARRLISKLSPRERIVLGHLTLGSSSKNIAHDLDLSIRTVDAHRANIVSKLEVPTLAQALRIAFEAGDF